MINRHDIKLTIILFISAIIIFIGIYIYSNSHYDNCYVCANVNGTKTKYDLDKNNVYTLKNGIKIQIKDKGVSVIYSPCKNQICVNHKTIYYTSESIVCLPNNTIITIEGTRNIHEEVEYDGIAK